MPRKEILRSFSQMLACGLSDAELQVRGNKLAHQEKALEELDLSHKEKRAALREEKKALVLEIQALAAVVLSKKEEREVKCLLRAGKREGWVEVFRTDTSEVITTRKATDAEKQGDLLPDFENVPAKAEDDAEELAS